MMCYMVYSCIFYLFFSWLLLNKTGLAAKKQQAAAELVHVLTPPLRFRVAFFPKKVQDRN